MLLYVYIGLTGLLLLCGGLRFVTVVSVLGTKYLVPRLVPGTQAGVVLVFTVVSSVRAGTRYARETCVKRDKSY